MKKTPYEVVGVDRSASPDEIKKAYRHKARALHPDVAGASSTAAFQELNRAHALLMDKDRRADYDATGCESQQPLEQKHVALLLQAFHVALFSFIGGVIKDIPSAIRSSLQQQLREAEARARQGKDDAARLAKIRGKITRTRGENWMGQQVDLAAERVDQVRQQIAADIGDLKKALEILPEFSFPSEEPPAGWAYAVTMPAQPFRDHGFNFPHGDKIQFNFGL